MSFTKSTKTMVISADKHGHALMIVSFLVVSLTLLFIHLRAGLVLSPDSHSYIAWANRLIDVDFNLFEYYREHYFRAPSPIFYTIPVCLIAIFKHLLPETWQLYFFYFNLSLLFLIQWLIFKSLVYLGVRKSLIGVAMPLLLISADFVTWPRYLLSDMIYATLVMALFYTTLKCRLNKRLFSVMLIYLISVIIIARPTAPSTILAFVLCLFIPRVFPAVVSPKFLTISLIGGLFLSAIFYGVLMYNLQFLIGDNPQIEHVLEMVNQGVIVHDRPDTWVRPPNSWHEISTLFLARFVAFFSPYAETFSVFHNAANTLLLLVWISGVLIWFGISRNQTTLFNEVTWIALLLSAVVACYHSATIIDFDWRYRFPVIAPLIVFSVASWEYLTRHLVDTPD